MKKSLDVVLKDPCPTCNEPVPSRELRGDLSEMWR